MKIELKLNTVPSVCVGHDAAGMSIMKRDGDVCEVDDAIAKVLFERGWASPAKEPSPAAIEAEAKRVGSQAANVPRPGTLSLPPKPARPN